MERPWYIDIMAFSAAIIWMLLTFATIQQRGPTPTLLASAVTVLGGSMFFIYRNRISYLRVGDWLELDTREVSDNRPRDDEPTEWQKENR